GMATPIPAKAPAATFIPCRSVANVPRISSALALFVTGEVLNATRAMSWVSKTPAAMWLPPTSNTRMFLGSRISSASFSVFGIVTILTQKRLSGQILHGFFWLRWYGYPVTFGMLFPALELDFRDGGATAGTADHEFSRQYYA